MRADQTVGVSRSRLGHPLVVVSSGSVEDVRAEGFGSQVVVDPDWTLSSRLGADGTPMAMLVDHEGRVASPLVTGGPAILELLGASTLSAV